MRFIDAPFLGRTTGYSVTATLRPTARLQSELRLTTNRFVDVRTGTEAFNIKILYGKSTYQLTPRLLLRNIFESNTLNRSELVNLVATYRVNAGTAFIAGYDDRYREDAGLSRVEGTDLQYHRTNRAIFAKLQYLYRR